MVSSPDNVDDLFTEDFLLLSMLELVFTGEIGAEVLLLAALVGDARVVDNLWVVGDARLVGDARVVDDARVAGDARRELEM